MNKVFRKISLIFLSALFLVSMGCFVACNGGEIVPDKVTYTRGLMVGDTVAGVKIDGVIDKAWDNVRGKSEHISLKGYNSATVLFKSRFGEEGLVLLMDVTYDNKEPIFINRQAFSTAHNTGIELYLTSGNAKTAEGYQIELDVSAAGVIGSKRLESGEFAGYIVANGPVAGTSLKDDAILNDSSTLSSGYTIELYVPYSYLDPSHNYVDFVYAAPRVIYRNSPDASKRTADAMPSGQSMKSLSNHWTLGAEGLLDTSKNVTKIVNGVGSEHVNVEVLGTIAKGGTVTVTPEEGYVLTKYQINGDNVLGGYEYRFGSNELVNARVTVDAKPAEGMQECQMTFSGGYVFNHHEMRNSTITFVGPIITAGTTDENGLVKVNLEDGLYKAIPSGYPEISITVDNGVVSSTSPYFDDATKSFDIVRPLITGNTEGYTSYSADEDSEDGYTLTWIKGDDASANYMDFANISTDGPFVYDFYYSGTGSSFPQFVIGGQRVYKFQNGNLVIQTAGVNNAGNAAIGSLPLPHVAMLFDPASGTVSVFNSDTQEFILCDTYCADNGVSMKNLGLALRASTATSFTKFKVYDGSLFADHWISDTLELDYTVAVNGVSDTTTYHSGNEVNLGNGTLTFTGTRTSATLEVVPNAGYTLMDIRVNGISLMNTLTLNSSFKVKTTFSDVRFSDINVEVSMVASSSLVNKSGTISVKTNTPHLSSDLAVAKDKLEINFVDEYGRATTASVENGLVNVTLLTGKYTMKATGYMDVAEKLIVSNSGFSFSEVTLYKRVLANNTAWYQTLSESGHGYNTGIINNERENFQSNLESAFNPLSLDGGTLVPGSVITFTYKIHVVTTTGETMSPSITWNESMSYRTHFQFTDGGLRIHDRANGKHSSYVWKASVDNKDYEGDWRLVVGSDGKSVLFYNKNAEGAWQLFYTYNMPDGTPIKSFGIGYSQTYYVSGSGKRIDADPEEYFEFSNLMYNSPYQPDWDEAAQVIVNNGNGLTGGTVTATGKVTEGGTVVITPDEGKSIYHAYVNGELVDFDYMTTTGAAGALTIPYAEYVDTINLTVLCLSQADIDSFANVTLTVNGGFPYGVELLKGATVSYTSVGASLGSATTDDSGVFTAKMMPGEYTLSIPSYEPITLTVGTQDVTKEITLNKSLKFVPNVSGKVSVTDATAQSGATLEALSGSTNPSDMLLNIQNVDFTSKYVVISFTMNNCDEKPTPTIYFNGAKAYSFTALNAITSWKISVKNEAAGSSSTAATLKGTTCDVTVVFNTETNQSSIYLNGVLLKQETYFSSGLSSLGISLTANGGAYTISDFYVYENAKAEAMIPTV